MAERILMQLSGSVRPLQLSQVGSLLSSSARPGWRGLPLEVQPLRDWEGDADMGPLRGSLGLLVFLGGQMEFVARKAGRDRPWTARAGDATVISGQECPRLLACRGKAQVAAVDLSSEWMRSAIGAELTAKGSIALGSQASVTRHVRTLVRHLQAPADPDPLAVEGLSLDLVSALSADMPAAHAILGDGRLTAGTCRRLQDYVRSNLDSPITLTELADLAGCSPRRFSTLFKDTFGTTPYKFVVRSRLMEAARLLRTSRHDLAEVAYDVGFSSQSHFSTAFHSAFRVRPRDYVRHWRATTSGPPSDQGATRTSAG